MNCWGYIRENLETRIPIIMQQNPGVSEERIRILNTLDPTKDKAIYTPWLVRVKEKSPLVLTNDLKFVLKKFHDYNNKNLITGRQKDINSYKTYESLRDTINKIESDYIESRPKVKEAADHYNISDSNVMHLINADPSGIKGEYLPFLIKAMAKGQLPYHLVIEDAPRVKEALKKYEYLKSNNLIQKTLDELDLHGLFYYTNKKSTDPLDEDLLDKLSSLRIKTEKINNNTFDIYKITSNYSALLSQAAASTHWCVKHQSTANSYFAYTPNKNDEGAENVFYLFLNNKAPFYLAHYPTLQYKNVDDEAAKDELGKKLISSLFGPNNILKPFIKLIDVEPEQGKIPFFRTTSESYLEHLCREFSKMDLSKEKAYPLIRKNFRNNYSNFVTQLPFNDFYNILSDKEKVSFKEDCIIFSHNVSDSYLNYFIDHHYFEKI